MCGAVGTAAPVVGAVMSVGSVAAPGAVVVFIVGSALVGPAVRNVLVEGVMGDGAVGEAGVGATSC